LAGVEGVSSRRREMAEGVGVATCADGETVDTGAGSGWDWVMATGTTKGSCRVTAVSSTLTFGGGGDSECVVCASGFTDSGSSPGVSESNISL